jgi:hypothetical protein
MYCKMNEQLTFTLNDEEVKVPSTVQLCDSCGGEGKSSAYLGAFTGQRLEELQLDDDFREDYLAGRYDRPCERCGGHGRIRVPDEDQLTDELRQAIAEWDEEEHHDAYINRQERLMEGGWREEGWYDS